MFSHRRVTNNARYLRINISRVDPISRLDTRRPGSIVNHIREWPFERASLARPNSRKVVPLSRARFSMLRWSCRLILAVGPFEYAAGMLLVKGIVRLLTLALNKRILFVRPVSTDSTRTTPFEHERENFVSTFDSLTHVPPFYLCLYTSICVYYPHDRHDLRRWLRSPFFEGHAF